MGKEKKEMGWINSSSKYVLLYWTHLAHSPLSPCLTLFSSHSWVIVDWHPPAEISNGWMAMGATGLTISLKSRIPGPWSSGYDLSSLGQRTFKQAFTILLGKLSRDYGEERRLLLHTGGRASMSGTLGTECNTYQCPVFHVNGKWATAASMSGQGQGN